MRITIKKGTTIADAMDRVKEFLMEEFGDFDVLKSNANLYINLQDEAGDICPQNEREYEIDVNGEIHDVRLEMEKKAIKMLQNSFDSYCLDLDHQINRLEHMIDLADNYLATAAEMGRKPENIKKRKIERAKNKKEIEEIKSRIESLNRFNERKEIHVIASLGKSKKTEKATAFFVDKANNRVFHQNGCFIRNGLQYLSDMYGIKI